MSKEIVGKLSKVEKFLLDNIDEEKATLTDIERIIDIIKNIVHIKQIENEIIL